MKLSSSRFGSVLALLGALALNGCLPSPPSQMDEEREPHFLSGKTHVNEMDFRGAVGSFEKALEVNPRSGAAHFELAIIFEKREPDAAAAIYHFEQYLRLRPTADNADVVKQHIMACKQELARTVSLGPVTERQQKEFERYVEENKHLQEQVTAWKAETMRLRAMSNASPASPPTAQAVSASATPRSRELPESPAKPASVPQSVPPSRRSYTVRQGDTMAGIAKKSGVKVQILMAANPRLDPRRLRPGQTLTLAGP
jgi:tetratricopeptide (TPR) repeat protein